MAVTTKAAERRILRIGEAPGNTPGRITFETHPGPEPGITHSIDDLPYPFAEGWFDEVSSRHLIERSADPMALMAELHRITRGGGLLKLTALHWTNPEFATDLRNRNHISSYSFRNLTLDRVVYDFYTEVRFNQRAARLTMPLPWKLLGFEFFINLDNRYRSLRFFRQIWEHYLNCIVRGTELHFELEVLKDR